MDQTVLQARPKVKKSAPDYVIDQIRQALVEERLKPGDKFPAEPELEELYGVSRGSVRQAMKSLEMLGVISIRPGDGTYVNSEVSRNSFNSLAFALLLSRPSDKSITEARYALERDIVELILDSGELTAAAVPLLKENIARHKELMDTRASAEVLVENDQAFHHILSQCCGNPVLQTVYDYVLEAFRTDMISTTSLQQREDANVTIRDHTAILQAISTRDFSLAKQAIKTSMRTWGVLMSET